MNALAEPAQTLEAVAEHFEQWRERKQKGERIPEQLWREAIGLVDAYGISRVTRRLRLSVTDLNKRRGIVGTRQRRRDSDEAGAFVEVERALVDQALSGHTGAGWMELIRPDGLRLRMQPTDAAERKALLERFIGV